MAENRPKIRGFTWTVEDVNLINETETWGEILVELGTKDPRLVALTADLGNSTKLAHFKRAFPERFFNVGVAEQNLMAVAAGMAATDLVPVVCTYATFATLRAAEFIRTDLAYGGRNVKIVGTLAGVAFGQGGPTHHSVEDVALMRAIPGMVVLVPSDGTELGCALRAAIAYDGPVYLRTGRGIEQALGKPDDVFVIGKAHPLRTGDDLTVIACGPPVHEALRAAARAETMGISVQVINMASLKPLDAAAVVRAARETGRLITVEDHNVVGGLGSAVADVLAAHNLDCTLQKLGHQDRFLVMGIPEDLMALGGFDEDAVLEAICTTMGVELPRETRWDDDE